MFNHFITSKKFPFARLSGVEKRGLVLISGKAPFQRSVIMDREAHSVSCHQDGLGNACFTQFPDDSSSTLVLKELCDAYNLEIVDGFGINIHRHSRSFLVMYEEFKRIALAHISGQASQEQQEHLRGLMSRWRKLAQKQGVKLDPGAFIPMLHDQLPRVPF